MTNKQLLNKMKNDMKMRNFSHYTYESYLGKTKDIMRYFGEKDIEDGSMSSFWTLFLRIFLFFNSLSFFFHTACFSISSGVL